MDIFGHYSSNFPHSFQNCSSTCHSIQWYFPCLGTRMRRAPEVISRPHPTHCTALTRTPWTFTCFTNWKKKITPRLAISADDTVLLPKPFVDLTPPTIQPQPLLEMASRTQFWQCHQMEIASLGDVYCPLIIHSPKQSVQPALNFLVCCPLKIRKLFSSSNKGSKHHSNTALN
jgi:hypothetical protein